MNIDFTRPEHALVWPVELFADELGVVSSSGKPTANDQVAWLLEEAFIGPATADRWREATAGSTALRAATLIDLQEAPKRGLLRPPVEPPPLWSQRRSARTRPLLDAAGVRGEFARLAVELFTAGYFARDAPIPTPDDPEPGPRLEDLLRSEVGTDVWPFETFIPRLDDDAFYDLIEVLHDHAARPRRRTALARSSGHHSFGEFAAEPGRRLYRWRVNQLLERSSLGLRLANSGADAGRLVEGSDDARNDLVELARQTPDPDRAADVDHAIEMFRARNADVPAKRSAIATLYGLFESRRELLKQELFSKDEDALFQIANQFAIRHRNEGQKAGYDPVFLDWVFWWYLATVELTDRLLERQQRP